jgi:hypothetical protein
MQRGDTQKIHSAIASLKASEKTFSLILNSPGGDVDEAMALGKYLRSHRIAVQYYRCASACAIAAIGSISPPKPYDLSSTLIIHRPSISQSYVRPDGSLQMPHGVQKMMLQLKDYTVQMTKNSTFYDLMIDVDFYQPRALTQKELDTIFH